MSARCVHANINKNIHLLHSTHGAYRLIPITPFLDYTIMQTRNHWNYFKKILPVQVSYLAKMICKNKNKKKSKIELKIISLTDHKNLTFSQKFRLSTQLSNRENVIAHSPQKKKEKSRELMIMYLENLTICSLSNPYIQASYLNSTSTSASPSSHHHQLRKYQNNSANNSHKCLATFSFELRIVKRYIFACRFGSNRNNTPTCAALV